jgi:lipopolysaccharide export system protein LptA
VAARSSPDRRHQFSPGLEPDRNRSDGTDETDDVTARGTAAMTHDRWSLTDPRILRGACAGAALAVTVSGAVSAQTQGVPNAMQGFSQNRDQPIQIDAASLVMRDRIKEATFAGDVKVVQGDTTMKSRTLVVHYDSADAAATPATVPIKSATPGPAGSSSIRRLEATGSVVVTRKDQTVTGETAIFDTRTNLITMKGDVVLTQCMSVLCGDRLVVDMTTGASRVESDSGHVQGLFPQFGPGCTVPILTQPSQPG